VLTKESCLHHDDLQSLLTTIRRTIVHYYGANIEHEMEHGSTALLLATKANHIELVCLLLDCGANIEHPDYNGMSALKCFTGN
jgi:ankyrin repeat protein